MYKSMRWFLLVFFLFLCFMPSFSSSTLVADTGCGQAFTQYGSCVQIINLGWVAFGGTVDPQRWETRINLSGVEWDNPHACSIHATIMVFDAKPLPPTGGNLNLAKKILVNYYENHDADIPGVAPKVSTTNGISYDLKNGQFVEVTLLSSVENPLTVRGASITVIFNTSSLDCLNGRVPMHVNYLAEQPVVGYTFNVFQNEPFAVAPKWYFSAESSPQGSRAGLVDTALNVYNPSSVNQVAIHLTAYDQLGRLVASTASDRTLDPMETWSATLSSVFGPIINNFLGRIYVSSTAGPVMVTAFKRIDLGMAAPAARVTIY